MAGHADSHAVVFPTSPVTWPEMMFFASLRAYSQFSILEQYRREVATVESEIAKDSVAMWLSTSVALLAALVSIRDGDPTLLLIATMAIIATIGGFRSVFWGSRKNQRLAILKARLQAYEAAAIA